jgi:inhibitor of KinA sporulation pathway (predicted exonuclease)
LVFLDLEYNQLQYRRKSPTPMLSEIIEMGFIVTDYNLKELNSFNYLVKPTIQTCLHPHVATLTGITQSKLLQEGIDFINCMNRFKQLIGDDFYIITWGYDDVKVLKQNCYVKRYPFSFLGNVIHIDAQRSYMRINNLSQQPSLKSISNKYTNIINKEHRAIDDVKRLITVCKEIGISNVLSQKEARIDNSKYLPKEYVRYLENRKRKELNKNKGMINVNITL